MSFDIYAVVTDRIIQQLESGVIPWQKPWTGVQSGAYSGTTGKPYSLLNQMILGKPGAYFTFNEATKRGGKIRKGEKSSMIVFWKQVKISETDPATGELKERIIPMLRYFNVFHQDQIEGITINAPAPVEHEPIVEAEEIIKHYTAREGLTIQHQRGNEAFYSPLRDCIVLPLIEQFPDIEEYYSTAFHEMTHSTGHRSRLNRLKTIAHFGNEDYSKEELTAEIGAAALVNYTGIETKKSLKNSAAYIQSWLLCLDEIEYFVHQINDANKVVGAIELTTNGTILDKRIIDIYSTFVSKDEQRLAYLRISNDQFHDVNQSKKAYDFYSQLAEQYHNIIVRYELKDGEVMPIIRFAGRAKNMLTDIDKYLPYADYLSFELKTPHRIKIQDNNVSCTLIICPNGGVVFGEDFSFNTEDEISIGNIKDNSLSEIINRHNDNCLLSCCDSFNFDKVNCTAMRFESGLKGFIEKDYTEVFNSDDIQFFCYYASTYIGRFI